MTVLAQAVAFVAGSFLLGLLFGLVIEARKRRSARPVRVEWADGEIVHRPGRTEVVPHGTRLAETVRVWLADPRPAWETVDAFERDVTLILSGGWHSELPRRVVATSPRLAKEMGLPLSTSANAPR